MTICTHSYQILFLDPRRFLSFICARTNDCIRLLVVATLYNHTNIQQLVTNRRLYFSFDYRVAGIGNFAVFPKYTFRCASPTKGDTALLTLHNPPSNLIYWSIELFLVRACAGVLYSSLFSSSVFPADFDTALF